eukprot:3057648-Lingulodinium_polyedra.AAC.1
MSTPTMSRLVQRCSGSRSGASGLAASRGPRPSRTERQPERQRPGRPALRLKSYGPLAARQDRPCVQATCRLI